MGEYTKKKEYIKSQIQGQVGLSQYKELLKTNKEEADAIYKAISEEYDKSVKETKAQATTTKQPIEENNDTRSPVSEEKPVEKSGGLKEGIVSFSKFIAPNTIELAEKSKERRGLDKKVDAYEGTLKTISTGISRATSLYNRGVSENNQKFKDVAIASLLAYQEQSREITKVLDDVIGSSEEIAKDITKLRNAALVENAFNIAGGGVTKAVLKTGGGGFVRSLFRGIAGGATGGSVAGTGYGIGESLKDDEEGIKTSDVVSGTVVGGIAGSVLGPVVPVISNVAGKIGKNFTRKGAEEFKDEANISASKATGTFDSKNIGTNERFITGVGDKGTDIDSIYSFKGKKFDNLRAFSNAVTEKKMNLLSSKEAIINKYKDQPIQEDLFDTVDKDRLTRALFKLADTSSLSTIKKSKVSEIDNLVLAFDEKPTVKTAEELSKKVTEYSNAFTQKRGGGVDLKDTAESKAIEDVRVFLKEIVENTVRNNSVKDADALFDLNKGIHDSLNVEKNLQVAITALNDAKRNKKGLSEEAANSITDTLRSFGIAASDAVGRLTRSSNIEGLDKAVTDNINKALKLYKKSDTVNKRVDTFNNVKNRIINKNDK